MAVARLRGVPPSDLLRVGCEWCAYSLDEALLVRDTLATRRRMDESEAEASGTPGPGAVERVKARMRADGVIQ